jgi:hypothetical protein
MARWTYASVSRYYDDEARKFVHSLGTAGRPPEEVEGRLGPIIENLGQQGYEMVGIDTAAFVSGGVGPGISTNVYTTYWLKKPVD